MKRILIIAICCLVIGGVTGWLASSFHDFNNLGLTLRLIKEGELAERVNHAESAYFIQKWDVAAWELENLNDALHSYSTNGLFDTNYLNFQLFLANARLANTYDKLGDKNRSQKYIESAMEFKQWSGVALDSMTNTASLFQFLGKIDSLRTKLSNSENNP